MAVETADAWTESFARASNEDPELQAHGKYYSCSFLLDMGEHQYIVRVHRGEVEKIVADVFTEDRKSTRLNSSH